MLTFPDSLLFRSGLEQSQKKFYLSCGNEILKVFCSRKHKTLFFALSKIKHSRCARGEERSGHLRRLPHLKCNGVRRDSQHFLDSFCDVWSTETPQSHSLLGLQTSHAGCCNSWAGAGHHPLPENTACETDKKAPAWVWQKFPESKISSWNILALAYGHESITSFWLVRKHVDLVLKHIMGLGQS